jgi:hypothetical protein
MSAWSHTGVGLWRWQKYVEGTRRFGVGVIDAGQLEHVLDHFGDEEGLMQLVVKGRWEEERLGFVVAEALVRSNRRQHPIRDQPGFHLQEPVATRGSAMGKFSQTRKRIANRRPTPTPKGGDQSSGVNGEF